MSAGGLSYHGIVGYGKATLPSVETWSTNMNILRDPPKSITTRKIDKVGDTSEITQMIQDSGDRVVEGISVYARGTNPMVGVQFSNYGRTGQSNRNTNMPQAFLPYRIMRDGAFRPPILDQRSLLPLSRLPRVWTSSFTQPGFADYSKKALESCDARTVKKELLKACAQPTAFYKIEKQATETYDVKYVIKNPVAVSASSGIQSKLRRNGEHGDPTRQIQANPVKPDVHVNPRAAETKTVETYIDTDRYTHDVLQGETHTANRSHNVQVTPIDQLLGVNTDSRTRNTTTISHTPTRTGVEKHEYIHNDVALGRTLPVHEARTNVGQNIYKRTENQQSERVYTPNRPGAEAFTNTSANRNIDTISSREYNLRPTINPGGFEGIPTMPQTSRENTIIDVDTDRVQMRQRVYGMQMQRQNALSSVPYDVPVH